jgi:1-phosphatidylinositol-3-phosphate 5-kinase
MQNVFFGLDVIQRVYDLKGSEVNRLSPPKGTGMDTNFMIDRDGHPYLLDPNSYDRAMAALADDTIFLREQCVIDYSLLVIESGLGLRMAIIDFMRPYHLSEKLENLYKEIKNGKDPTVIPPHAYADRFIRAMRRYFAKSGQY